MSASDGTAAEGSNPAPGPRIRELITPEGVDLRLVLADASERAAAFFLDILFIILILVVLSLLAIAFAYSAGMAAFEPLGVLWLLGSFFLRNFYFVVFELTPRAATPGKRIIGLRVAARSGAGLTADAVFARNAMRELELFLPLSFLVAYGPMSGGWGAISGLVWCSIFVFFPLLNKDRLRVGDFVGGTWVIRAPRRTLEIDLAEQASKPDDKFAFTQAEVDVYGAKELAVLEEVLRVRDRATMTAVAHRIRKKIGRSVQGETNEAFLEAYYLAIRARLEGRLLFGQRKRDKHDI